MKNITKEKFIEYLPELKIFEEGDVNYFNNLKKYNLLSFKGGFVKNKSIIDTEYVFQSIINFTEEYNRFEILKDNLYLEAYKIDDGFLLLHFLINKKSEDYYYFYDIFDLNIYLDYAFHNIDELSSTTSG